MISARQFVRLGLIGAILTFRLGAADAPPAPQAETVQVAAGALTTPLPHFWETMFGSGRAILSLRESYRRDLRATKVATDFRYVRFHNILHDEVGVVGQDKSGRLSYNFSYVDEIYDGLLENGVRPFVELSFMPETLAENPNDLVPFWYRPIRSPPKSAQAWVELVHAFLAHLIERYGVDEVAQWYFEVWNEPNIDFWGGIPKRESYFEFYGSTARAVKAVDARLRVGGPATAATAWIGDFIRFAEENHLPLDFIATHVYGNDSTQGVFGEQRDVSRQDLVCLAAKKVREEIRRSARPNLPFVLSEFNASYKNEPGITDSIYMAPWLANTVRECVGLVDMMSYWTFSDVFEEQGVVKEPFYGGYGLMAARGIPKPAFNAFALLHKLGDRQYAISSPYALATRRADGAFVVALWNPLPEKPALSTAATPDKIRQFNLRVDGLDGTSMATLYRLDADHGNTLALYTQMGKPRYPTSSQIDELRVGAQMVAERIPANNGRATINVPAGGLVVVELSSLPQRTP